MATGTTPLQPLPPWMSWAPVTVPLSTGGYSISFSIVNLPLTYYGPSIPLGTGPWTWGGLTSPASASSTIFSSFSPPMTTSTTAIPSSRTTTPPSSTPPSSLPLSTTFSSSSSTPHTVTSPSSPTSTRPSSAPGSTGPTTFSPSLSSTTVIASSTSGITPPQHHHLSHGALAGIVVGSVIGGLALLGFLSLCLWLNLRYRRQSQAAPPQVTGDSSFFGGDIEDNGEWQAVVPRSSGRTGPSGDSGAGGESSHRVSPQGSGHIHRETVHYDEALVEPNAEIARSNDIPSSSSSLYVAIPGSPRPINDTGRLSWFPWRRNSARRYQDMPPEEDAAQDAVGGQDAVSPPMSPRSVQYSDGHNSDVEQETLLHIGSTSAAAVTVTDSALESPDLASSSSSGKFVERAREAVAQRNARQRASYIPGAAGFFTWFRHSWASSWRTPRTPDPNADELGFRPRSEKSAPGSKISSTRGDSRGPARSQRSKQSSVRSEKSGFIPQRDSDESPPAPHSSQFPTPPPTHLEAHAMIRQLSQASNVDYQYRTVSPYSAGGGSVSSGNTVYYDAMDVPPLPNPLSPHLHQSHSESSVRLVSHPLTEMGELVHRCSSGSSELLAPPPIRDVHSLSPLSIRPPASLRSLQLSLRSLACQADDVLDEPPPLPSVSLERRGHCGYPVPSSPPPSYTDEHHLPPPGLEEYGYSRVTAFDRSDSHTTQTSTELVDVLEEEPPSAGSQWRQMTGDSGLLPFEDHLTPPVRVTTHFRSSSTLEHLGHGALTPPRAGSVHSTPLLHSAPASFSGRGVSTRAPSSAAGRRATSLISRISSRSHSVWSRLSRDGYALTVADGLTRMPSLSAFGNPPPLDEYAVGEIPEHPGTRRIRPVSRSRPSSITSYGYAV